LFRVQHDGTLSPLDEFGRDIPQSEGAILQDHPLNQYQTLLEGMKKNADASPGVVEIATKINEKLQKVSLIDRAALATAPIPIAGDIAGLIADLKRFADDPKQLTPVNMTLSGLGLLPFVPGTTVLAKLVDRMETAQRSVDNPSLVVSKLNGMHLLVEKDLLRKHGVPLNKQEPGFIDPDNGQWYTRAEGYSLAKQATEEAGIKFERTAEGLFPGFENKTGSVELRSVADALAFNKGNGAVSRADAFDELANLQKGDPERIMTGLQKAFGGGVWSQQLEHVGDIIHRMTADFDKLDGGYEFIKEKVDRAIKSLDSQYGFAREHASDMRNNYRLKIEDSNFIEKFSTFEVWKKHLSTFGERYADAFKKLPAHNKAQQLAKDAAISIGEQNFDDALVFLKQIKTEIDKGRDNWKKFAGEFDASR